MECRDCRREMATVFLGDDKAYDECDCGLMTEVYDVKDDLEFGVTD